MNNLVFNNTAKKLYATIFGVYQNSYLPVALDSDGLFLFSPESVITITATDLDIRQLRYTIDSVTVTASNLDIRPLNGAEDSVTVAARVFVEQNITQTVSSGTTFILERNISPYSQNSFFVRNTSGATITLIAQVAPTNDNSYYVNHTTPLAVGVGANGIMVVTAPMKFARVSVQAGSNTGIVAYYNGRA